MMDMDGREYVQCDPIMKRFQLIPLVAIWAVKGDIEYGNSQRIIKQFPEYSTVTLLHPDKSQTGRREVVLLCNTNNLITY